MPAAAQIALAYDESAARSTTTLRPNAGPHMCASCHLRPARFQYRGVVKADRFHTLCFQCYRSVMDSIRNVEPVSARITWIQPGRQRTPARHSDKYEELARRRRRAQMAARHLLEERR